MFILGHAGLATGAVRALFRDADLRWIPVCALLPDMIDKPIWLVFPSFANGWTRSVAHSLTGLAIFSLIVIWRLRARAWPLVLAYASHLVLDRMWFDVQNLIWPFSGFWIFPQWRGDRMELWWEKFTDLWTMGGEALGALIFISLTVRAKLWDPERRRAFTTTGRVA
jgi:hypothetical protein